GDLGTCDRAARRKFEWPSRDIDGRDSERGADLCPWPSLHPDVFPEAWMVSDAGSERPAIELVGSSGRGRNDALPGLADRNARDESVRGALAVPARPRHRGDQQLIFANCQSQGFDARSDVSAPPLA